MDKIKHDLRLSETISPFGVGAIVDVRGESLIAPDTSWWETRTAPEITCERLLARLGAGVPPAAADARGAHGQGHSGSALLAFPGLAVLRTVRQAHEADRAAQGQVEQRLRLRRPLGPDALCGRLRQGSHIQDIPWIQWVHRGPGAQRSEAVRFLPRLQVAQIQEGRRSR
ncbi:hypothetical protein ACU686_20895 [Yinghuangia aomiensis]